MPIQADQKKYLKDRLQRINNEFGTYSSYAQRKNDSELEKPAEVVAAEVRINQASAIVRRFEKRVKRHNDKIKKNKRAFADRCEREILSGNFKSALALLDKFEQTKF